MSEFRSGDLEKLYAALAAFNKEYPNLTPDKKNYRNEYISYHSAMQAVRPILARHGLSITGGCRYINNQEVLITKLSHSSGQWEEYSTPITLKDKGDYKQIMGEKKRLQTFNLLSITNYNDDIEVETINFAQAQHLANLIGTNNKLCVTILKKLNVATLDKIPRDKFEVIAKYISSENKEEE